jgi:hypothetical protein
MGTELLHSQPRALDQSTTTQCAEHDNVNIPFLGTVASFTVEAMHPGYHGYHVSTYACMADFTNCPPPDPGYPFPPGVFTLFDDGETVVEAVREASWWRPNGMAAAADDGAPVTDMHYVRVSRKIPDANEWPQFLALYMDGNLRLIPHPPGGAKSVCFGSSVIIGPAAIAARPIAEISSVRYLSKSQTLEIMYRTGGSAHLIVQDVNRAMARVWVIVRYPTDRLPFATLRSMFVAEGNADVDHVQWEDAAGRTHDDAILTFPGGNGTEWCFYRRTSSRHNPSAPDLRISLEIDNFIVGFYQDAFGRMPSLAEVAAWVDYLAVNPTLLGVGTVVHAAFDGPEYRSRPVTLGVCRSPLSDDPRPLAGGGGGHALGELCSDPLQHGHSHFRQLARVRQPCALLPGPSRRDCARPPSV